MQDKKISLLMYKEFAKILLNYFLKHIIGM